ncbi:hypothetical protein [Planobispora rosea]|uniref:hypothetical protein n=1 Tax=Planobispora rosea TaxID=35762 RepID=UPI000839E93E|nr:hypothetical protein [Planobispora rosea]
MSPTPQQTGDLAKKDDAAVEDDAAVDTVTADDTAAKERATAGEDSEDAGTAEDTGTAGADVADVAGSAGGTRSGFAAWRGRLIGAVVAMAAAGAVTFGVIQWMSADRLADRLAAEKAERLAVSTRAGEFAVALQTYDHDNLQAYRDHVFGLSGEDFEKTYDAAFSPLESVITAMKATSTASIRGVYVGEVSEGRAKAITIVDSQVKSTAGTRRLLGTYMELGLVKTGGQWKVNDATVMGAADELLTDPDGKEISQPDPSPSPGKKKDK